MCRTNQVSASPLRALRLILNALHRPPPLHYDEPMTFRTCGLLLSLLLAVGCASTKATFEVAVKNATSEPISVGLVKIGGSVEPGWDGPEHVAMHAPMLADRKWGTLIEPGAVVTLGPQSGR